MIRKRHKYLILPQILKAMKKNLKLFNRNIYNNKSNSRYNKMKICKMRKMLDQNHLCIQKDLEEVLLKKI